MDSWFAHFILVNDPALELFIPFLLTASFLHNLVDGQMLQTCVLTENLAVTCLSHARGASDDYVWFVLRHKFFNVDLGATGESRNQMNIRYFVNMSWPGTGRGLWMMNSQLCQPCNPDD